MVVIPIISYDLVITDVSTLELKLGLFLQFIRLVIISLKGFRGQGQSMPLTVAHSTLNLII